MHLIPALAGRGQNLTVPRAASGPSRQFCPAACLAATALPSRAVSSSSCNAGKHRICVVII